MATIQVFDKPMCCSTGICGPEVDPALVTLAADLQWLERQGVQVQRINPAHQPTLFAASELVLEELKKHGSSCLPLLVVNNSVVSRGVIPNRTQLADWAGISLDELTVIKSDGCGDAASRKWPGVAIDALATTRVTQAGRASPPVQRVRQSVSRVAIIPWLTQEPTGSVRLLELARTRSESTVLE